MSMVSASLVDLRILYVSLRWKFRVAESGNMGGGWLGGRGVSRVGILGGVMNYLIKWDTISALTWLNRIVILSRSNDIIVS